MSPTVSIVTATYNRSAILRYAIQSVLEGSFQDWELIIVGDACTDDTEAVVRSFADPRIRLLQLERNFGEQSGPNNVGVQAATGEFLAFLNHDDLWLPDHLERSLQMLRDRNAELVFGQGLLISAQGDHGLIGALGRRPAPYAPWMVVPASLWVMRTELARRIGPWRPAKTLRTASSQDWLYRAHRAGAALLGMPTLSALLIQSGSRPLSYLDPSTTEHQFWYGALHDPARVRDALSGVAGDAIRERQTDPLACLDHALRAIVRRALMALGVWPPALRFWLRLPRKGALIRSLRRRRGLPPSPP